MPSPSFQNSALKISLVSGAALIALLSSLYFYLEARERREWALEHDRIRQEIHDDIYQEVYADLKGEIQEMVKAEVKTQVDTYLVANPQSAVSAQLSALPQESSLQQMVRVAVKDIFNERQSSPAVSPHPNVVYLTDAQLARYVASGGVETEVSVGPGAKAVSSTESGNEDLDSHVAGVGQTQESLERTLEQRGSILLPKGTWQVEPSFTWAHFSSSQVTVNGITILDVFTIGEIFTNKIKRDVLIQTTSVKYGLANNLQVEMKVPARYQHERRAAVGAGSSVTDSVRDKAGIGDIEFGVSRQVAWEKGLVPDLVANLTVKTPTGEDPYENNVALGTGHWAVRTSLVAARASDPMVFFGSLNYTANLPRNGITNYGDIDPGDSIGWSAGTAIALSYKAALNFSFDHTLTMKTKRNDSFVAGSFVNAANFKSGISWAIDDNKSLDFSVGMGLTDDAPDVTVDVRVPIKF